LNCGKTGFLMRKIKINQKFGGLSVFFSGLNGRSHKHQWKLWFLWIFIYTVAHFGRKWYLLVVNYKLYNNYLSHFFPKLSQWCWLKSFGVLELIRTCTSEFSFMNWINKKNSLWKLLGVGVHFYGYRFPQRWFTDTNVFGYEETLYSVCT